MARLTDEEFRAWCQHNNSEPRTEASMQCIRESSPERRVHSRASNVSGRYQSVKMGCSIQFESKHVELWGIYTMERDSEVLEMYDQPTRIQLHYQARSGRKTSPWHTPDFLVVRQNGAGCEAWKHASSLDTLAISQPHRYQRNASGAWKSPSGEQAAQLLGLSYRVRTSAEYHPSYIQNVKVLQDFWTHPFSIEEEQEPLVLESLQAYPGVSVKSLFLYRSAAEVPGAIGERQASLGAIPLASRLLWDGRLWEAEVEATTVVLRPESGAVFTLTLHHFQRLVNEGVIMPERLGTPSPLRACTREILAHAGPKALEAAHRRWRWFGEWSLGCIGVLSDWLVETVDALCRLGAIILPIEALKRHALYSENDQHDGCHVSPFLEHLQWVCSHAKEDDGFPRSEKVART